MKFQHTLLLILATLVIAYYGAEKSSNGLLRGSAISDIGEKSVGGDFVTLFINDDPKPPTQAPSTGPPPTHTHTLSPTISPTHRPTQYPSPKPPDSSTWRTIFRTTGAPTSNDPVGESIFNAIQVAPGVYTIYIEIEVEITEEGRAEFQVTDLTIQ